MKRIKLKDGREMVIDDDVYDVLINKKINLIGHRNHIYPSVSKNGGQQSVHRFIMNAKRGDIVDHIDGNILNNQRENLRFVTHSINMHNRKPKGTSKYLGVFSIYPDGKKFDKKKNKFIFPPNGNIYSASISINNKTKYLGSFKIEEDAALAYNEAAKKYHGEFANLNVIDNKS